MLFYVLTLSTIITKYRWLSSFEYRVNILSKFVSDWVQVLFVGDPNNLRGGFLNTGCFRKVLRIRYA